MRRAATSPRMMTPNGATATALAPRLTPHSPRCLTQQLPQQPVCHHRMQQSLLQHRCQALVQVLQHSLPLAAINCRQQVTEMTDALTVSAYTLKECKLTAVQLSTQGV